MIIRGEGRIENLSPSNRLKTAVFAKKSRIAIFELRFSLSL